MIGYMRQSNKLKTSLTAPKDVELVFYPKDVWRDQPFGNPELQDVRGIFLAGDITEVRQRTRAVQMLLPVEGTESEDRLRPAQLISSQDFM